MESPQAKTVQRLTQYASGLRFPALLALVVVLFVVDLFVPDFVPFADEVLLGLLAVILARLRKPKPEEVRGQERVERDGTG